MSLTVLLESQLMCLCIKLRSSSESRLSAQDIIERPILYALHATVELILPYLPLNRMESFRTHYYKCVVHLHTASKDYLECTNMLSYNATHRCSSNPHLTYLDEYLQRILTSQVVLTLTRQDHFKVMLSYAYMLTYFSCDFVIGWNKGCIRVCSFRLSMW